jgi:hypothetical protein
MVVSQSPQLWGRFMRTGSWAQSLSGRHEKSMRSALCHRPFTKDEFLKVIAKKRRQDEIAFINVATLANYDYNYQDKLFDKMSFLPGEEMLSFDQAYDLYRRKQLILTITTEATMVHRLRHECYQQFIQERIIEPTERVLTLNRKWNVNDVNYLRAIYDVGQFLPDKHTIPVGQRRVDLTNALRSAYDKFLIHPNKLSLVYDDLIVAFGWY